MIKKKEHLFWILLVMITLCLTGCSHFNKSENSLEKKLHTEISYLDNELIMIANEMNNINYTRYKVKVENIENNASESNGESNGSDSNNQKSESDVASQSSEKSSSQSEGKEENSGEKNEKSQEEQGSDNDSQKNSKFSMSAYNILDDNVNVNWNELKSSIEKLYTSWTTISVDLKEVGVSDEQLAEFSSNLDLLAIAIKNENVNETMDKVIKLYEFLPMFASKLENENDRNILECKNKLLYCYKYANEEDWNQFNVSIDDLKMRFSNIVGNKENYKGKENNLNSAFVIIDEMKNSGNAGDKSVFLIKYKNLIQEFNIISEI